MYISNLICAKLTMYDGTLLLQNYNPHQQVTDSHTNEEHYFIL